MIVRKIQEKDVKQFIELDKVTLQETSFLTQTPEEFKEDEQRQLKKIQGMLESEVGMVFVAEDEGKLAGYVGVTRFPKKSKVKHIANFMIVVLKEYQGTGIASELLKAMEDFVISYDISRIEMTVMAHNSRAIAFYEKHGYVKEGVKQKAIYMNGEFFDEIYMAKLI